MTGLRPVRWRPDHLYMSETPASARLRRAVRAIILADDDRVLLCRFGFPHPAVPAGATVVWAAPGGGIEPGELPLAALRPEAQPLAPRPGHRCSLRRTSRRVTAYASAAILRDFRLCCWLLSSELDPVP